MTELQQLEVEILDLQEKLNLRGSLTLAVAIGERLQRAKELQGHGKWAAWCARMGINVRTAATYKMVAREAANRFDPTDLPERISMDQFLRIIRTAKIAARKEHFTEAQAGADAPDEPSHRVACCDCRKYSWPRDIDAAVADPPWADMDAYRWLAPWAAGHLREGGILIVQCGVPFLPEVLDLLKEHLSYVHTMALSYGCSFGGTLHAPFQVNWRPVLLFAKGRFLRKTVQVFSDVFTVGRQPKSHHPWEQPLEPFVYWLGRLTNPGQLVCDTHAGSGTIGVACQQIGRRYLGTEIDPGHARTARRRIAEARPERQGAGSSA